jgi:acyl-CoA dehydrogenase
MDFALSPESQDTCRRIDAFLDRHVIPLEGDRANYDEGENIRLDILAKLRGQARAEGLWCFQVPKAEGGNGAPKGQTIVNMAACYETAGRSIFGPVCFNIAAPDDGNLYLLNKVATPAQKERWLNPILRGEARSAIVMTEPAPGSGSDPAGMMRTTATKHGDTWVIKGHKWFITGAGVADHFIVLARTSDDPRRGLTTFLFHKDQPGWKITRRIGIMGPEEHGGHCELEFDGLEIPIENVLLGEGQGMKVTQIRLAPAGTVETPGGSPQPTWDLPEAGAEKWLRIGCGQEISARAADETEFAVLVREDPQPDSCPDVKSVGMR